MAHLRFPCTGRVSPKGFPKFLESELGDPRRNIGLFASELAAGFGGGRITLVNSGSSANLAAALALREETGRGEAITAGFTFPTTVAALQLAGYTVRVADTERGGFNLDPQAFERAITPSTKVVCVTHFLGFPAKLRAIIKIARAHGILVLQDACETMHLPIGRKPAHQFGDLTTWSFYHPHHISAYGGGAVIAHDPERHRLVESVAHWGRECTCHYDPNSCRAPKGTSHQFYYKRVGQNIEMSELNAAFGRWQLRTWDQQESARMANYRILHDGLREDSSLRVWAAPSEEYSPFVFPISVRSGDAQELSTRLRARGVEVRTLMGGAITRQPAYRRLRSDGAPNCLALAASAFFVGIHQTLPHDDVRAVAQIIREEATR
jgi:CDP-6-deoxy-D-xylo-4-hexulose-3-dehydrase